MSAASRLLNATNMWQENVVVHPIISFVMPVGDARCVPLVATFFRNAKLVQDAANQARGKPGDFICVTMSKRQIFNIQDVRTGLVDLEKTYYQCASAGLSDPSYVCSNVMLVLVKGGEF